MYVVHFHTGFKLIAVNAYTNFSAITNDAH